ncbi:MAG: hypothetical protein EXS35_09525 [Pedosphaera sp.]|nr:hypothetical protein [Pedosphaera sp.]
METKTAQLPRRHVWPWFVLAALILGGVLAVIWMRAEIRRMELRRSYQYDQPITNTSAPR